MGGFVMAMVVVMSRVWGARFGRGGICGGRVTLVGILDVVVVMALLGCRPA